MIILLRISYKQLFCIGTQNVVDNLQKTHISQYLTILYCWVVQISYNSYNQESPFLRKPIIKHESKGKRKPIISYKIYSF